MGTIKLNPDKLKKKIKGLRDKSDEAGRARANIDTESKELGDPSPSKAVYTFHINSATHINNVRACADRIESEMNRIIELNQSGVATMNGGTITVENVPDTILTGEKKEFETWKQGALDAKDLQTVLSGKTPKSGRSYQDITKSMGANKDNANYSRGVIDTIGAENLTQLPLDATNFFYDEKNQVSSYPDSGKDLAGLLGTLLASASHTWSAKETADVAEKIYTSVNIDGQYGRITVLNSILGGHDANGDHINDLNFTTNFLDELAPRLEKIDWEKIRQYAEKAEKDPYHNSAAGDFVPGMLVYPGLGQVLTDRAFDPMAGVLDAMGNSPDAAMHFLAPPAKGSKSDADTTRMERLAQRNWESAGYSGAAAGYSGFTAALAALSTKRASSSTEEAARASDATGTAIHNLAYYGKQEFYNDDAKARVGMILANCAPEVTATWADGIPTDPRLPNQTHTLPGATYNDITALGYKIADSPDATATLSAGIGEYTHRRAQERMAQHPNDKAEQVKSINLAYNDGVMATGFLAGLADEKAKAINKDSEKKAEAASASSRAAINVFTDTTLAGLGAIEGGPAGVIVNSAAAKVAKPALTTMLTPVIADATGGNNKPVQRTSAMTAAPNEGLYASAVQEAANSGLLDQQDFEKDNHQKRDYKWITQGNDGNYKIDLKNANSETYKEVKSWTSSIQQNHSSPTLEGIENDFNGNYAGSRSNGAEAATNLRVHGKPSGTEASGS